MYTPENLKRMAAAGIKYGRLYFYKGFGLEYDCLLYTSRCV